MIAPTSSAPSMRSTSGTLYVGWLGSRRGRAARYGEQVLDYIRDAAEIYRQSFAAIRAEAGTSTRYQAVSS